MPLPTRIHTAVQREIRSFQNALRGIEAALRDEPHLRFHALAAGCVIGLGACLKLSVIDWALLASAIALVVVTEMLNTALERLTNLVTQEFHTVAKATKDIAAGAVLLSACYAIVIGVLVFGARFFKLLAP